MEKKDLWNIPLPVDEKLQEMVSGLEYTKENTDKCLPKSHTKPRKKNYKKYFCMIGFVFVLLAGLLIGHRFWYLRNYENKLEKARLETTIEKRIQLCQKAIKAAPKEMGAYLLMLDSLLADYEFSKEDEQVLLSSIQEPVEMEGNSDFAKFAYKVGNAYLYYYTYGSVNKEDSKDNLYATNLYTRMQSCNIWFKMAAKSKANEPYHKEAVMLRDLSNFWIQITGQIAEGKDKKKNYQKCWKDIENLMYLTPKKQGIETLMLYGIVMDSIQSYRIAFLDSGIKEQRLLAVMDRIREAVKEIPGETAKVKQWKKWLIQKDKMLNQTIQ